VGAPGFGALILDSGALIAIERGEQRMRELVNRAVAQGVRLYVPATAVAEVWRGGGGRQARLAKFLGSGQRSSHLHIVPLDFDTAKLIGLLLARAGAGAIGGADAMVAWCALHFGGRIITSDPGEIQRLVAPERVQRL